MVISFFCCTFAPANKQQGTLADRLGNGLQNRVEQFDSARYLFSQSASVVLQPCGFFYPQISTDIIFYWIITDFILFFGTEIHSFFLKVTALLRDWNGLICLKAILKYRHGSLTLVKKSVLICANLWTKKLSGKENCELAPASRNHEVPWLYQCGAKSRVFEKAVSIRAKKHSPVPIIFNLHTEKVQLIINTDCS